MKKTEFNQDHTAKTTEEEFTPLDIVKAPMGGKFMLTSKGLDRLVGISRSIERAYVPQSEDCECGEEDLFALVDSGFVVRESQVERPGYGVWLTDTGLAFFAEVRRLYGAKPDPSWVMTDCPDILVWLAERGYVRAGDYTMMDAQALAV